MKFLPILILIAFISCTAASSHKKALRQGVVLAITNYSGNWKFVDTLKIWYRDSAVIEEIHTISSVTESGRTTTTYPIMFYRFIDLYNKAYSDYRTFSDTAVVFNKGKLSDFPMEDAGWSFYTDFPKLKKDPEMISDTVVDNILYKRGVFNFEKDDTLKRYRVGYFRCDLDEMQFSLEKTFSAKLNCPMTKSVEYNRGELHPYSSREVLLFPEVLTRQESKVFDAWEKNVLD